MYLVCWSPKMLQNVPPLAILAVHTAESEPNVLRPWKPTTTRQVCSAPRRQTRPRRRWELRGTPEVRSRLNKLFIFSKLREARSRLYRSQILQPNTYFAAFFEIYKIIIPLHRSDLKIPAKKLSQFWQKWINSLFNSFEFSQFWH